MAKKLEISLEKLLLGGAHYGHQMRRWNPKMAPYMHEARDGVFVFDLIKTRDLLAEALEVIKKASSEGKIILWVGTKKQAKDRVKAAAEKTGCPYITERWLGGIFTNFDQVISAIKRKEDLEECLKTAKEEGYTKKEILIMKRKLEKIERIFGGILNLKALPDMIIVVDTKKERGAVLEAKKSGIPVIGIVDSNGDPDLVKHVIPMNDDADGALEYVIGLLGEAFTKSKSNKKSDAKA